jgi:hypothetical protein
MLKRLKFEIDPLVNDILGKIPLEVWESEISTFLDPAMGGGQFIREIIRRLREHGHSDENIAGRVFGIENGQLRVDFAVNKYNLIGTYISTDFLSWETDMKFDVIVTNPPYQMVTNGNSNPIWHKFILKSFDLLKEGGNLVAVHPSGWRDISGTFSNVKNAILSKNVKYLEIHNEKDGMETFGAETRYDVYHLVNEPFDDNNTTVKFEDGVIAEINLNDLPFIPNYLYDRLKSLIADIDDERVELLFSHSAYEPRKTYVSDQKTDEFRYPVVYTVTSNDTPTFKWSSTNQNGHFGIPKLIWSNGRISSVGSYIDATGEYGLTNFSYGIVDTPENLPKIKAAFDSKEFRDLMYACSFGILSINRKIISLFRKDFWKEFV